MSRILKIAANIAMAIALTTAGVAVTAAPATAAGIQTIYMNAAGSDANTGATPANAVRSLARVQELVLAGPLDQDVEVRVHAGTYVAAGVVWTTYRPGHTISFMPDDYEYGEGLSGIPRSSTPPSAHYLKEVNTAAGECSSYHNRFTNNDLGTFLVGSTANLPTWYLYPAGATWPGSAGCPALPAGETRLTTAGNAY